MFNRIYRSLISFSKLRQQELAAKENDLEKSGAALFRENGHHHSAEINSGLKHASEKLSSLKSSHLAYRDVDYKTFFVLQTMDP